MRARYDVVIVGGGLIGAACADRLAGEGRSVCLLEAGPFARESSWAGAGILHPIHPWDYPEPLQALLRAAPAVYDRCIPDLEARTGRDVEYDASGLLVFGEEIERLASWLGGDCPHSFVEAANDDPSLRAPGPALLLPDARQVRSHLLARAFLEGARLRGADVFCYRPALELASGAVRTAAGTVEADTTVLCAGAWAARLLPGLDVEPVRGQMLLYRGRVRRMAVFADGSYVVPRRGGLLLFGSTLEHVGFAGGPTEQACDRLAACAAELLGMGPDDQIAAWAGFRPGTKSLHPYLCRHPQRPDLVLACGHYRNGILLAPLTAQIVADLVGDRPGAFETGAFSPPR